MTQCAAAVDLKLERDRDRETELQRQGKKERERGLEARPDCTGGNRCSSFTCVVTLAAAVYRWHGVWLGVGRKVQINRRRTGRCFERTGLDCRAVLCQCDCGVKVSGGHLARGTTTRDGTGVLQ